MTEGVKIETVGDLVGHIKTRYKEELEKAERQQKEYKKKLQERLEKESKIVGELKATNEIMAKMQNEYEVLEKNILEEQQKKIEGSSIVEEDVLAGRVGLDEFLKKGKRKEQRTREAIEQTQKELAELMTAIRKKGIEILRLEESLYETQKTIYNLHIQPARILQKSLKDLDWFINQEAGEYLEAITSSHTKLDQTKVKIRIATERRALQYAFSWDSLSIAEAERLQFDPVIPVELISELKKKLRGFDPEKKIRVVYYLPKIPKELGSIEVNAIALPGQPIKTGDDRDDRK